MTPHYTSLEFAGPRKSLFYFIVALSALALVGAALAIASDYLLDGRLAPDNVVLELSASNGTLAEYFFGTGMGAFGHFASTFCGASWLLSAGAWMYAFLSWREFMRGERTTPRHVFFGFLCAFFIEFIGILTWPSGADTGTYMFGLLQLSLSGYVCLPVILELRNAQTS